MLSNLGYLHRDEWTATKKTRVCAPSPSLLVPVFIHVFIYVFIYVSIYVFIHGLKVEKQRGFRRFSAFLQAHRGDLDMDLGTCR
jgi:hypothetical protein